MARGSVFKFLLKGFNKQIDSILEGYVFFSIPSFFCIPLPMARGWMFTRRIMRRDLFQKRCRRRCADVDGADLMRRDAKGG